MTVQELKRLMIKNEDITIIDIREIYEFEDGSICELNIPLDQFMIRINEIPKDKPVILYCNSGKRSKSLKYMVEKYRPLLLFSSSTSIVSSTSSVL